MAGFENRKCSCVMLYDEHQRVLYQFRDRKEGIIFSGVWSPFGGKIEDDETPLEGATRELEEELGIIINDLEFFKERDMYPTANITDYYFIKEVNSNIMREFRISEGRGLGWFHFDEFEKLDFGIVREHRIEVMKELEIYLSKKD